jgi:SEC-C motif-containing protein
MRSRYSAYVRGNETYLLDTWHQSTRPNVLDLHRHPLVWQGLEVVRTVGGKSRDNKGKVEFIARFLDAGHTSNLHETSRFVREHGRWYYLDGVQTDDDAGRVQVARNAACPCGSGKKYKRCCGQS